MFENRHVNQIDNLIDSIPDTTIERFEFYIKRMGYGDNVVNDEIQANLTTGDINEIEDDLDIKISLLFVNQRQITLKTIKGEK